MIDFIPRHLRPNESWGEKRSNNESTPLLIYKQTSQLDNDNNLETTCTTADVSPLPSYGNYNDTPSLSSSSEHGNTGLKGENKRLKAEIQQLRAQVVQLRKNKKGGPKPVPANRGRTLDRIAARLRNCRSLSSGPATDRSEADPCLPLEMHESAAGLHHRRHPENSGRALEFVNLHREEDDIEDDEDITSIGLGDYDHSNDVEAQDRRRYRDDGDLDNDDHLSFSATVVDRAGWLVGLLILQSLSSFIIKRNEALLQNHAVIVQFLTMLVGAGGNAGNQASVKVIRGLALGTINPNNYKSFLTGELKVGITLSAILGLAGCLRAAAFMVPFRETMALTMSLFAIVWTSTILGSLLPLAMKFFRIDPAHSSTTIQVVMDILGVTITVHLCGAILGNSLVQKNPDDL